MKMTNQRYRSVEELPLTLTIAQVQNALGISRNSTYALVRSGELPSIRLGRVFLIPKQCLIDYLNPAKD